MNFSVLFGVDLGGFLGTCGGLLVFGFAFNWLVDWFHQRGLNEGYTWLQVVFGTAVTVAVAGFTIGWAEVVILFAYFAASGFFMAGGDIWRHVQARQKEIAWKLKAHNPIADFVDDLDIEE